MGSFQDDKIPTPVKVVGAGIAGLLLVGAAVGTFTGGNSGSSDDGGGSGEFISSGQQTAEPEPDLEYAKVRPGDVRDFLLTQSTFSWDWPVGRFEENVVAAGAVPGSEAVDPPYRDQSLALCIEERCFSAGVRVEGIVVAEDRSSAEATVFVDYGINGVSGGEMPSQCIVTVAFGRVAEKGLFTAVSCVASGF